MTETVEVKIARMEERMKSLEKKVDDGFTDLRDKVDKIFNSISDYHEKADREYVTKTEFLDLKTQTEKKIESLQKNIIRNLIGSNLLTASVTAIFMYLLNYYLTHK